MGYHMSRTSRAGPPGHPIMHTTDGQGPAIRAFPFSRMLALTAEGSIQAFVEKLQPALLGLQQPQQQSGCKKRATAPSGSQSRHARAHSFQNN